MKIFINIMAAFLIIIGVIFLSYKGFSYSTHAEVAELPFNLSSVLPVNIGAETDVSSPFSRVVGGVCLVAGILLLIFNRMKR